MVLVVAGQLALAPGDEPLAAGRLAARGQTRGGGGALGAPAGVADGGCGELFEYDVESGQLVLGSDPAKVGA